MQDNEQRKLQERKAMIRRKQQEVKSEKKDGKYCYRPTYVHC